MYETNRMYIALDFSCLVKYYGTVHIAVLTSNNLCINIAAIINPVSYNCTECV